MAKSGHNRNLSAKPTAGGAKKVYNSNRYTFFECPDLLSAIV